MADDQPERRLRCSRCGNRQVGVTVHPDTRPHEIQASEGPRPETRAGLPVADRHAPASYRSHKCGLVQARLTQAKR